MNIKDFPVIILPDMPPDTIVLASSIGEYVVLTNVLLDESATKKV